VSLVARRSTSRPAIKPGNPVMKTDRVKPIESDSNNLADGEKLIHLWKTC